MARLLLITGRVQGVGFRYFTYRQAAALDVCGWVRNLPSGQVEAHFEGSLEAVLELERHMASGPRFSSVTAVDATEVDNEEYERFEIR